MSAEQGFLRAAIRRWTRRLLVILLAGAPFVAVYAARANLLPPAARLLDVGEHPSAVDYCMVLGGGSDTRPFAAAALYRAGLVKSVLLARSKPSPENEDAILPREDEIIRNVLMHEGVPEEGVTVLEPECASTRDEAQALAGFLERSPSAKAAVVTTGYHTRRTRRVFREELGPRAAQVSFIGVPTEAFSADNWWQSRDGFVTYLNEYFKSAYYCLRY